MYTMRGVCIRAILVTVLMAAMLGVVMTTAFPTELHDLTTIGNVAVAAGLWLVAVACGVLEAAWCMRKRKKQPPSDIEE
jgi:hypothetical protein